ncbi:MAG TPA: phosphonoacetate hydrolase [Devosiaceae bacterium]
MTASQQPSEPLLINGRSYRRPVQPVVIICFDGCDPAYLEAAGSVGAIPTLTTMMRDGFYSVALAAMPTFTNPNNVAIVCGAPPAVTGVAGNYYLDRETGREVMVLDGHQMEAETILARFSAIGDNVAIVTAKDKLLKALARGHDGIALSAESPAAAIAQIGPIGAGGAPDKYSADLSLFVLDAGIALLERHDCDVIYLSLSDYVEHKHAPETSEAIAFMQAVDRRLGRMVSLGAVVGIVADHGMNDMANADGTARIVLVQDEIERTFGAGSARVICPITDPFTRHHASLGGFVRVYLNGQDANVEAVRQHIASLAGVEMALTGAQACARFELPLKGEADIVVVGQKGVALGATAAEHDLSQLAGTRLRSHGSTAEQPVPFILSHPLDPAFRDRAKACLRNFDIFDYALNGVTL